MNRLVVNRDGVFLVANGAYTAWSRAIDRQWLVDQLDTRPRPLGGVGIPTPSAPPTDPGYRWPGAFLRIGPVPGAAVLPDVVPPCGGRNVHAALATGSSPLTANHTPGEPRPIQSRWQDMTVREAIVLPLRALRRIRRWS